MTLEMSQNSKKQDNLATQPLSHGFIIIFLGSLIWSKSAKTVQKYIISRDSKKAHKRNMWCQLIHSLLKHNQGRGWNQVPQDISLNVMEVNWDPTSMTGTSSQIMSLCSCILNRQTFVLWSLHVSSSLIYFHFQSVIFPWAMFRGIWFE